MLKLILFFFSISAFANLSYKSTDNTGQNKFDRIDHIEKFLSTLEMSIGGIQKKLIDSDTLLNKQIQQNHKELQSLKKQIFGLTHQEQEDQNSNNLQVKVTDLEKKNEELSKKVSTLESDLSSLREIIKKNYERDLSGE